MKSDYLETNIIEGRIKDFRFKTHERFKPYYFNQDQAFENQSTHHVESLLKEGDVFIDVGAHHGYYSLVASIKVGPKGKIIAFEPVPENRKLLSDNLAQLSPETYKIYDYAVSEKKGKASFNIPWASDSAGLFKHPLADTLKTIEVELRSLDDLFSKSKVDFVKIDTEGNELQVLKGMNKVVRNNPGIKLLVEFNPLCLKSAKTKPQELLDEIKHLGFDIYIVDEENSASLKLSDNSQWQNYLIAVNYRNLLCVPKGTPSLLLFTHTAALQGAERATVELAAELQTRGAIVCVSIPGDGAIKDYCRILNISTTKHRPDWWINQKQLPDTGTQIELEKSILYYDYDSVLDSTIANPIIPICAKRLQKKVVWYVQEDITRFTYPYEFDQVNDYIEAVADSILVPTLFLKSKLEKAMPSFQRAEVLHSFPKIFNAVTSKSVDKHQVATFVMIGRMEQNKNQLDGLKALAILSKNKVKQRLLLIGGADEDYKIELQNFINENKLQNQVSFEGEITELQTVFNKATALLSCSYSESFGRTLVEAMSAGIPTITSSNGGSKDFVVNNKNAFVYKPGDHQTLAELLQKVVSEDHTAMVQNALQTVQELKANYHKQLDGLFLTLKDFYSDKQAVVNKLNHNYISEITAYNALYKTQLELNEVLKQAKDELAKEHIELIKAHRNIIDSRLWRYANSARRLLRSRNKKPGGKNYR